MTDGLRPGGSNSKKGTTRTFFGHPLGLLNLFSTEFCERFSYYGMRAILVYYIYAASTDGGLGLTEQDALYVMTLFGSSVYLLSIVGGWLADRLIGSYRSVFYGGIVIAVGHVLLGLPFSGVPGTFAALSCIALGTGLLKPNVSQMVGTLYTERDRRRQAGFNIFVMGINLGSFFSPLIIGAVKDSAGYHVAFLIPAVFMVIALLIYRGLTPTTLRDVPKTAPNPLKASEAKRFALKAAVFVAVAAAASAVLVSLGLFTLESFSIIMPLFSLTIVVILFAQMFLDKSLARKDRHHLLAYIAIFIASTVFWAVEELQSSVFAVLAKTRADNDLLSFVFPAEWYQSINPLVIIILAPLLAVLWQKWKGQPSLFVKISIGLILTVVSFVIPAIGFADQGGGLVSPLLLAVPIILFSAGELFVSPVGLSATTELAPLSYQSRLMSMWFLSNTLGQGINAFCVRYFDTGAPSLFFGGYAVAVAVVVIGIALLTKRLNRLVNDESV
ncbi:MAG: oligopeptide:H+ symporter [Coriobacteriales bacterium]|jgi:POT family proton-dependent oligopeptide transporter|nr:oligopeptide:H+ symporter [Coriobacteriales bacterium]